MRKILLLIALAIPVLSFAQTCSELITLSQKLAKSGKYKDAIGQFREAKKSSCSHDQLILIDREIKACQDEQKINDDFNKKSSPQQTDSKFSKSKSSKSINSKAGTTNSHQSSNTSTESNNEDHTAIRSKKDNDALKNMFDNDPELIESEGGAQLSFTAELQDVKALRAQRKQIPTEKLFSYVWSAYYHSWDLMNERAFDEAAAIMREAMTTADTLRYTDPQVYYGLSGIYNGMSKLYSDKNYGGCDDRKNGYYAQKAVYCARKAVNANTSNTKYKLRLINQLRNLSLLDDSLVSKEEKRKALNEACTLAQYLQTIPGKHWSRAVMYGIDCTLDKCDELTSQNKYKEAMQALDEGVTAFDKYLWSCQNDGKYLLKRAKLYGRMAEISLYNLKDTAAQEQYLDKMVNDWDIAIEEKNGLLMEPWLIGNVFNTILDQTENLKDTGKIIRIEQNMYRSVETLQAHIDITEIATITVKINAKMADMLLAQKRDTAAIVKYLAEGIRVFEKSNVMSTYHNDFSEDIAIYAKLYKDRLLIDTSKNNLNAARKDYASLMSMFKAYDKKNHWDFYFLQHLIKATDVYGGYLCDKGYYKEAVPALRYASYEGKRTATDRLIKIYQAEATKNNDSIEIYSKRAKYQRDGMKRFTVPCDFAGVKQPFYVYILDRAKGYPYPGIDDQTRWLKEARGGIVPEDVVESFRKLQQIAWDNDVSFEELSVYALGEASKDTIAEQYKKQKEEIEKETQQGRKLELSRSLYDRYEHDIRTADTGTAKAIMKDAVVWYGKYAQLLTKAGDANAINVYKRILKYDGDNADAKWGIAHIDFEQYKANVQQLTDTKDAEQLAFFLAFYLKEDDRKDAAIVADKLLQMDGSADVRYQLSRIYLMTTGDNEFEALFLSDTARTGEFLDYFLKINDDDLPSDSAKRLHYYDVVALEKQYLHTATISDTLKQKLYQFLSSNLINLAWYCLLTKRYDHVLDYLTEAKKYNPKDKYPDSNIPHYYLLTGQYERAKKMYLALKNKPFDKSRFPTYRQAFLNDFEEFEKAGINDSHIAEIKKLLRR